MEPIALTARSPGGPGLCTFVGRHESLDDALRRVAEEYWQVARRLPQTVHWTHPLGWDDFDEVTGACERCERALFAELDGRGPVCFDCRCAEENLRRSE